MTKRGLMHSAHVKKREGKRKNSKLVTYFQGTSPYNPIGFKNPSKNSKFPSTGLMRQNDRTYTPIANPSADPNKREGGMTELALTLSQRLLPKPSSYNSKNG